MASRAAWLDHARGNLSAYAYEALADPAATIHVNPSEITRLARLHVITKEKHGAKLHDYGRIIGGDWDLGVDGRRNPVLEEMVAHLSVFQRYVEGRAWEDTPGFAQNLRAIEAGKIVDSCQSREDLVARYARLDETYDDMVRHGYRTERLAFGDNIFVSIDRCGGFLLGHGGKHRIAIARLLRLPTIEVYVLARHVAWQEVRERAVAGRVAFAHPDLRDLVRGRVG